VSPQLEVVLPSGNFYTHFVTNFNNLEIALNLSFSVLGNTLGGDLGFFYPFKTLIPYIVFYQNLDFENFFTPGLIDGEIILFPTQKYVRRDRGIDLGLKWEVMNNFKIVPSFAVNDVFKGNLTENVVLEEGVDFVPQTSLEYDSLRAEETETEPIYMGFYGKSNFSVRYRDGFQTPVEASNKNLLTYYHHARHRWYFDEEVTFNFPLKIWRSDLAYYYSLGGFESIRGYEEGSIPAIGFFLLSFNVERIIFDGSEMKIRLSKHLLRIHQFRLIFLSDTLLSRDRIYGGAPAQLYSSAGGGVSCTFSGSGSTHFQFKLCAAQALTEKFAPVIYFRSSLIQFEKHLQ